MCRSDLQAITLRSLHFEMCEVRLVLSAQPVSDLQTAGVVDSGEPIVLADIHASTGVGYAHDGFGLTGRGQTVAVIDSGIAYDHDALGGGYGTGYRIVGGWDFAEDDSDPFDDAPAGLHGTHIAGIIGSQHAEHLGVAPEVDLVALRVFDDQGGSDFEWVESALQWVYDNKNEFEHPITTVNLSLGAHWTGSDLPEWATLEDEFARLRRTGIFVSVAAGNNFEQDPVVGLDYPAASPHVVPVASHGSDESISAFSRRSNRVLVAPGEGITSTATDFIRDFNGITDDYYSASGTSMAAAYVSGASVLVRQAMETVGRQDISHDAIYGVLRSTAELVFDPHTKSRYHHIDVQAALDAIMPSPVHDLGTVTSQEIELLPASTIGAWYRFTAGRSGILTVETLSDNSGDNSGVRFEVFDTSRQPLTSGASSDEAARVDLAARAGQSFHVQLRGSNEKVAVRFTNLVSPTGQSLDVFGTPDADVFQLDLGEGHWLSVNGVTYDLPRNIESAIRIDGKAGEDTLRIAASDGDDTVWLQADSARLQGVGYVIDVDGTEKNYLYSGGGRDRAFMHDSEFDDTFYGLPDYSLLSGLGTFNYVEGFASVRAYSSHGGTDRAKLYDSPHSDVYSGLPEYSLFTGPSFRNYVHGFDDVRAYATHGGDDTARLFDSIGDDELYGLPAYSVMRGDRYSNYAEGFDAVRAYSHRGGSDTARLFGSAKNDTFYGLPEYSLMTGEGFDNYAKGFDRVRAYGNQGGDDEARLYDSSDNDTFYGLPEYALLTGQGFDNYAAGFELVRAYGKQGGYDEARLYDSSGDDLYLGSPDHGMLMGEGFVTYAFGFDAVHVRASRGGHDRAKLQGAHTDDIFNSRASLKSLLGVNYYHQVHDFEVNNAYAGDGGSDYAIFSEVHARDAIYRQASSPSWLESLGASVHGFPVIDVHLGDSTIRSAGYLAVDYLLQDDTTWL